MKLILIRHAKAEQGFSKKDRDRKLTPEGIVKFKQKLQKLVEKLSLEKKVIIWASSAKRSQETAQLIMDEISNLVDMEIEEAIYTGDFDLLLRKMESMDSDTTLLLVGHQPSLSYWSYDLTEKNISFATGDMVAFDLQDFSPLRARKLWKIS